MTPAGAAQPTSVAMVQVSKSKGAWVVALSFTEGHLFDPADIKVMLLARRMLSYHYQQLYASDELKDTLFGLVYCLTASIDAKDPYTCGHSERVARIAVRLGRQMDFAETTISDIYLAGLLHDIGKIGIKDSVLQKPGRLTDAEMRHVQEHPVIGDRIISNVKKLAHLRPGVRNHHERYDGQGYPDGLIGEEIPLVARLLAVADSCDAMMSPRPYRRAMPTRQIEAILSDGAGTQWDPEIVRHFLACRDGLYSICQRGIGESVYVAVEHAVRAEHRSGSEIAPERTNGIKQPVVSG
jgi:HD-GYP domain-containing protein (c-di-GMP phosphodiesterase class II)